jgi:hypothetical protein
MKRNVLIGVLIVLCIFIYFRQKKKNYYDLINAVSGATPLAVNVDVPKDASLTVDGMVKQPYRFTGSALNGFAHSRIRTKEYSPAGQFLGAYIYVGIPVFNILEGIAPKKPDGSAIEQPVDMIVTVTSVSGKAVSFSYNELLMVDDTAPITLAFHREPVWPTTEKVRETYTVNRYTENLTGLRLITPREPDVTRYLDQVTCITLTLPNAPDALLPIRKKKFDCVSHAIQCIGGDTVRTAVFDDVVRHHVDRWAMIGHGHGYDKTISADGFQLRSFLKQNFPGATASDYYLFVSCDGYRCLYSGHEIFRTDAGKAVMIVDKLDGQPTKRGFRLAPTADFFADRSMWGLSTVVRIPSADLQMIE